MVPGEAVPPEKPHHSPRIRGDGPTPPALEWAREIFSPYSRGWSHRAAKYRSEEFILPVFAGMVPMILTWFANLGDSPRIRGDGP